MLQPKLLKYVVAVLNQCHIEYMATGSVVSSLQGEPRSTHDVDIVINIKPTSVMDLIEAFPSPQFYLDEASIKDAINKKFMFNVLDTESGGKIDFWVLTEEPFDISRFGRKYEEKIFGSSVNVSSPEDTILAKLKWAKLSGGSEKQLIDATFVYEVQYKKLDLNYLQLWVNKLGLTKYWNVLISKAKPII